jgi:hypothetical protein
MHQLQAGGSRTISLAADVENDYFDRTDDPGRLTAALMRPNAADTGGGRRTLPSRDGEVLGGTRACPADGTIRLGLRATARRHDRTQGDAVQSRRRSRRDGAGPHYRSRAPAPDAAFEAEPPLGVPELVQCSKEGGKGRKLWDELEDGGVDMNFNVFQPYVEMTSLPAST